MRYLKIAFKHCVDTHETEVLNHYGLPSVFTKSQATIAIKAYAQSVGAQVGGFDYDAEDDDYSCILWKSYVYYNVSDYPENWAGWEVAQGVNFSGQDPMGGDDIDENIKIYKTLPENAVLLEFPEVYDPELYVPDDTEEWEREFAN